MSRHTPEMYEALKAIAKFCEREKGQWYQGYDQLQPVQGWPDQILDIVNPVIDKVEGKGEK